MKASWEKRFGVLEQKVDSERAQEIVSKILLVKLEEVAFNAPCPRRLPETRETILLIKCPLFWELYKQDELICCDYQCLAMNFRYTNHLHSYM